MINTCRQLLIIGVSHVSESSLADMLPIKSLWLGPPSPCRVSWSWNGP